MEEFEKILNEYLDDEIIREKFEQDGFENANLKKENKTKNSDFARTISISDFVKYYLGTIHDCSDLKHQGLKTFKNPYVVGVSNNFALKNPDCVIRDEIIVVIDAYGNPGSYINPNLLKNIETMEECKCLLKLLNKIKLHSFENINNLAYLHKYILLHIDELEQTYIDSCDLLKTLSKENLLKEMRIYVEQIHKTKEGWIKELLEVDNIIDLELNIINCNLLSKKEKVKIN